jgi:hypothetical protein
MSKRNNAICDNDGSGECGPLCLVPPHQVPQLRLRLTNELARLYLNSESIEVCEERIQSGAEFGDRLLEPDNYLMSLWCEAQSTSTHLNTTSPTLCVSDALMVFKELRLPGCHIPVQCVKLMGSIVGIDNLPVLVVNVEFPGRSMWLNDDPPVKDSTKFVVAVQNHFMRGEMTPHKHISMMDYRDDSNVPTAYLESWFGVEQCQTTGEHVMMVLWGNAHEM